MASYTSTKIGLGNIEYVYDYITNIITNSCRYKFGIKAHNLIKEASWEKDFCSGCFTLKVFDSIISKSVTFSIDNQEGRAIHHQCLIRLIDDDPCLPLSLFSFQTTTESDIILLCLKLVEFRRLILELSKE